MRRVVLTLVLLVVLACIGFALLYKRERRGVEFCPQTFEQRAFVYYVNAFGSYNMDRDPPNPCNASIKMQLQPLSSFQSRKRWDLVSGAIAEEKYDNAAVLVRYLDAANTSTAWNISSWSTDHPQLAKELWPRVQDLAVHNMYFAVPDIIRLALSESAEQSFISKADQVIQEAILRQLGYLIAVQRNKEKDIRLLRLIQWIERTQKEKAEVTDPQYEEKVEELLIQAKEQLGALQDGPLTSEEVVAS